MGSGFSSIWMLKVWALQGSSLVSLLFSVYAVFPINLIQYHGFKYDLYADDFQISMFSSDVSFKLQTKLSTPILNRFAAAAAKSLQSCTTLCDPIDSSPPGSPVPGILQARTPEWVAISFSIAWKWKVKVKSLSHFQLFMTPWTAAHQALPSMGFSRQEYCSGVPLPSPSLSLEVWKF